MQDLAPPGLQDLALPEILGVAVFALTGALVAARKEMDPFGFVLLATVTGVGGGTLRDLLLGQRVFWVSDPRDVLVCAGVAALAWLLAYMRPGLLVGLSAQRALLWADAAGLALFAAAGSLIAQRAGIPFLSAMALGAMTASFGGMARDVLAGDVPMLLRSRDFYFTAAAFGAAVTLLCTALQWPAMAALLVGFAAAFALRAASILFGWGFPALPKS